MISTRFPLTRFFPMLLITLAMMVTSCARKIGFQTSTVVPAAQGQVKIKKDDNNNYSLSISIVNLAESNKLSPPRITYVVWMETERDGTKNIGQLNSSKGLLSSKLKASLQTVTAFKPVRIYITAEDNASTQYPGAQQVFGTNRF